jgi:hypothetical protein
MDDPLTDVADIELLDAEFAAVVVERDNLNARRLIDDAGNAAIASRRSATVVGPRV